MYVRCVDIENKMQAHRDRERSNDDDELAQLKAALKLARDRDDYTACVIRYSSI